MEEYGLSKLAEGTLLIKVTETEVQTRGSKTGTILAKGRLSGRWKGDIIYLCGSELVSLSEDVVIIRSSKVVAQCNKEFTYK